MTSELYVSNVVQHRDEEFDRAFFPLLRDMQTRHFWYRGRHRFLLHALRRCLKEHSIDSRESRVIDIGGGCGGWIQYLAEIQNLRWKELALADSCGDALEFAKDLLPKTVSRHQVDLLNLSWNDDWDIVFLLDVLEHIPDDNRAIMEITKTLRPGGLLIVTVPAIQFFWSWNDEFVGHQRRYSRRSLCAAARGAGLEVLDARYFQFLLSPLYFVNRLLTTRSSQDLTYEQKLTLHAASHRVPHWLVNSFLTGVFSAETPVGHWIRFPWGTSCLGVFRKPA